MMPHFDLFDCAPLALGCVQENPNAGALPRAYDCAPMGLFFNKWLDRLVRIPMNFNRVKNSTKIISTNGALAIAWPDRAMVLDKRQPS